MDERRIATLAAAFQGGDDGSFRTLVDTLTRPLVAMAYRYTRDWEWARDLTQETWMSVYARIDRYDPARSFRSWLYTIHRNGCLDHVRRAWVRRELPADAGTIRQSAPADPRPDAQSTLERHELRELLFRAATDLSPAQREAFLRVDVEGGRQRQVAEALGMEYGTLRATLHFARRRVASMLREMGVTP